MMLDELTQRLTEALLDHDPAGALSVIREAARHIVSEAFGQAVSFIEDHLFILWGPVASAQALRSDVRSADGASLLARIRYDAVSFASA